MLNDRMNSKHKTNVTIYLQNNKPNIVHLWKKTNHIVDIISYLEAKEISTEIINH